MSGFQKKSLRRMRKIRRMSQCGHRSGEIRRIGGCDDDGSYGHGSQSRER